jgi:hypothetical protein
MGQPGLAGSQFPSEDALVRRVQDLERTVQQLAAANQLATAGIAAVENGIIVNGSETVNGPLVVNGYSEINGTMAINGPLILQPGSIENDALTSPIEIGQASASETNFATALTDEDRSVTTIAVPAGYTQALVLCIVTAGVINSSGSIDFLFLSASINGSKSRELYSQAPAGGAAPPITTSKSSLLTGLSGGVITLAAAVHSQANAWSANASSRAYVEAQAIFLR